MAEDKKGFLLYTDLIHTIEKMPNEKAGELFKHILAYVNDLKPVTNDLIIQLTFEPIKQQLKRDLIRYQVSKEDKSNAGKFGNLKRWNRDLYDKVIENKLSLDEALKIAENRKVSHNDNVQSQPIAEIAVNDNVNDNVNVNVNVNDILLKKETKKVSKPLEIVYPFESEKFKTAWQEWKTYKAKEHGFKFKSEISEGKTLKTLFKDSNENENIAIQMIENAISMGWKGIYSLKNQNNGTNQSTRLTMDERLELAKQRINGASEQNGSNQGSSTEDFSNFETVY